MAISAARHGATVTPADRDTGRQCRDDGGQKASLDQVTARRCSRVGCTARAVMTLTFVYADSAAVLGPLSRQREPGAYDLCGTHAERTSAPRGWEILKLPCAAGRPTPVADDLLALADAVREIGLADPTVRFPAAVAVGGPDPDSVVELNRRGHLRVITDAGRVRPRLG